MVEIIPKIEEKAPPWQAYVFYFSIALLIGVILSFFILGLTQKRSLTFFEDLKTKIAEEKTPQRLALEKEVTVLEKKIKTFSNLSGKHFQVSNFFEELEKSSHPRIRYSQLNLDTQGGKLTISGVTENFYSLGQQLLIFKDNPKILTADLSKIAISKKGQIEFTLDLSLAPEVFK